MGSLCDNGFKHDEEVNIYLKMIKTIPMKVKKSEKVSNLKTMLNDKEGISECLQELFFAGGWLHDESRLTDYGIQQNSTLSVFVQNSVPLRLNIKIPSQKKTITVEAKTYDRIGNVKSLISTRESIPVDDFYLVCAGHSLQNDVTLASLSSSIQETPTLYMISTPKYQVPIYVKTPAGEILEADVNVLQTVCDLKTLVESMVGFSLDDLSLTCNNTKLEDSRTLYYYNIQEQSVLEISPETIQVFIRDVRGETQIIEVSRYNNSVRDLKDRIFQKVGIPVHVQRLIFEGKCLNDDRDLASYNIQKNSSISLSVWTIPSYASVCRRNMF